MCPTQGDVTENRSATSPLLLPVVDNTSSQPDSDAWTVVLNATDLNEGLPPACGAGDRGLISVHDRRDGLRSLLYSLHAWCLIHGA